MTTPQPNPTSTLHSLPKEILSHTATFLSRTEVIELSRVSRQFLFLAADRVWDDLSLFLPDHYGEYPAVIPGGLDLVGGYAAWYSGEVLGAEKRHQRALRAKMKRILNVAGEAEWAKVKAIKMIPRVGSVTGILQVLEHASPTLLSLAIEGSPLLTDESGRLPNILNTIDIHLLDSGISFNSLTHLRLGPQSIAFADTILLICKMAPNLITLDVEMELAAKEDNLDFPSSTTTVELTEDTRIQKIRFVFESDEVENDEAGAAVLVSIIQHSPLLRQMSLPSQSMFPDVISTIMLAVRGHEGLNDLHWPIPMHIFNQYRAAAGEHGFDNLRRIMLRAGSWADLNMNLPQLPKVARIHIDTSSLVDLPKTSWSCTTDNSDGLGMAPALARQLRSNQDLRIIYTSSTKLESTLDSGELSIFTQLDASEMSELGRSGFFASIRHADHEVLHARSFTSHVEVADSPWPSIETTTGVSIQIQYETADETQRVKTLISWPEPAWRDYTDYQGLMVPLSVIERMRNVGGASREEWDKRGVEIGDEAGRILDEWYAAATAK